MVRSGNTVARRREILAAAGGVFDARGYAAATIDEVAGRAGVAKGSVYNYFRSKQDLFMGVFSQALTDMAGPVEQVMQQPVPASEKIHHLLDRWCGALGKHQRMGRLVLEFWVTAARQKRRGDIRGWFRDLYRRWRSALAAIIAQGIDSGEFGRHIDPVVAATLIMAVTDGIGMQLVLDLGIEVNTEFTESLKRAIFSGLTSPRYGGPGSSREFS